LDYQLVKTASLWSVFVKIMPQRDGQTDRQTVICLSPCLAADVR